MKNFIKNHLGLVCSIVFVVVFIPCSFLFKFFIDKEIERDKYHSYTRYEIYTEMNQLTYDSIKSTKSKHLFAKFRRFSMKKEIMKRALLGFPLGITWEYFITIFI